MMKMRSGTLVRIGLRGGVLESCGVGPSLGAAGASVLAESSGGAGGRAAGVPARVELRAAASAGGAGPNVVARPAGSVGDVCLALGASVGVVGSVDATGGAEGGAAPNVVARPARCRCRGVRYRAQEASHAEVSAIGGEGGAGGVAAPGASGFAEAFGFHSRASIREVT